MSDAKRVNIIANRRRSQAQQPRGNSTEWHRGHRDHFTLGSERGVYALFLNPDGRLSGIDLKADRLLYVGKAEGAGGFARRCHFDGKTRNHSPRKSLAVLLRDELNLVVVAGTKESGQDWGLDSISERRLSDWMRANLEFAIEFADDPSAREAELILALDPPLNLAGCMATDARLHLKRLRDQARREALGIRSSFARAPIVIGDKKPALAAAPARESFEVRRLTTAIKIAEHFGLNPKVYRAALRKEAPAWHDKHCGWEVSAGSEQQALMLAVARRMAAKHVD